MGNMKHPHLFAIVAAALLFAGCNASLINNQPSSSQPAHTATFQVDPQTAAAVSNAVRSYAQGNAQAILDGTGIGYMYGKNILSTDQLVAALEKQPLVVSELPDGTHVAKYMVLMDLNSLSPSSSAPSAIQGAPHYTMKELTLFEKDGRVGFTPPAQ